MTSLHDLQTRFYRAVLDREAAAPLQALVIDDDASADARVAVYRGNVAQGFARTLAAAYPVIEQLVGESCFRNLARDYGWRYPSVSGDLHRFGRHFAAHLQSHYQDSTYDYLAEVARLEWAWQESLVAPDAENEARAQLATFDPERYGDLTFRLHPAVRLLRSRYPVLRIWEAHQAGETTPDPIDLGAGGECVLVRRAPGGVALHRIEHAAFALLQSLAIGRSLSGALEDAMEINPDFALPDFMTSMFALGVFVGCALLH
jgi:hypothetical protein